MLRIFFNSVIILQVITFIGLNGQMTEFAIEYYIAHDIRSKKITIS